MTVNGLNGASLNGASHSTTSRPLTSGIFAPIPSFFLADSEDLDIPTFETHIVRLANAGVPPLIAGSMGEGIHLSHQERITLIKAGRKALDAAGYTKIPIIAGTGAGSTRETINLTQEAADAGADYAIVIASGYFAGALTRAALKAFWVEVSAKSPIPVIIYNFPGASSGIDLDSDIITELAEECPNLAGVKLTCGNVGKLTRIASVVSQPSFAKLCPRKNPDAPFLVLGGFADFILTSSYVNGNGAIIGLANVAPHATAKLFNLSLQTHGNESLLPEAQRLQGIIAQGDFTIAKTSIAGTKALMQKLYGYGGLPRKPLPPTDPKVLEALWAHPHVKALVEAEKECGGQFI
ncbi:aldolase [Athelia psychrophila]|uniref:Aldolase n=1 Tax=Athelia psychrophila TaxID=1759441 RepID=A0A166I3I5_9AGAM|nr:aldolase [Fibularhizoctonia sp. CBS 109695]